MGQAAVVDTKVQSTVVGYTPISNPIVFMGLNGQIFSSAYQSYLGPQGGSSRVVYPSVDSSGYVRINAIDVIFNEIIPQQTANVQVWAAG